MYKYKLAVLLNHHRIGLSDTTGIFVFKSKSFTEVDTIIKRWEQILLFSYDLNIAVKVTWKHDLIGKQNSQWIIKFTAK